MLYPWGKWAHQPADWELFWQIREDVKPMFQHSNSKCQPGAISKLWY